MILETNPFAVTKAVDFSDEEIRDTWVDLPGEGGFPRLVNLTSPMPMLIVGGKGSGRTHIMRYFSYALQKLRRGERNSLEAVQRDGYVGIYLRCEGLNAGRFEGKHQDPEVWAALFPYYMDLWLAQLATEVIRDLLVDWAAPSGFEAAFCGEVVSLFDVQETLSATTFSELLGHLRRLQREIDVAVNNVALTRSLSGIAVRASRGRLVFGIPQIAQRHCLPLANVLFLYLVDELENLTQQQQMYLNTLIREKQPPCSFKVGARLHGLRTVATLSAGEENREGSEYELLHLDQQLRDDARYPHFARLLIGRRLVQAGYDTTHEIAGLLERSFRDPNGRTHLDDLSLRLRTLFEEIPDSPFDKAATQFIENNYAPHARPYLVRLHNSLDAAVRRDLAPGIGNSDQAAEVVELMRIPEYPLLEKTNTFLLYQAWSRRENLLTAAQGISNDAASYISGGAPGDSRHGRVLGHFRADLLAQLFREARQQRQRYVGLDTFIAMSSGLPRLLLVILKHVYKWAEFNGEAPFRGSIGISMNTQIVAVQQAANWFFNDARLTGVNAQGVQDAIERLATLFRAIRFADKPVDPSLNTFSTIVSEASLSAQSCIDLARKSSLLIPVPSGHKDKNSGRVVAKFQLNPMLCPRFDLPLGRRGTLAMGPKEINAIFDDSQKAGFDDVVRTRLERMNAPFVRNNGIQEPSAPSEEEQRRLPGI